MAQEKIPVGFDLILLDEKGKPCANPSTKAIPVFKEIFSRGRRGTKLTHEQTLDKALNEFLYIYYMVDIRSFAVQRFPTKKEDWLRHETVRDTLKFPKDWKPDKVIEAAAEFYEEYQYDQSPSLRMLKTGFSAINKTIVFLESVDYTSKAYTPKIVMEYLESIQDQITRLEKLKQEAIRDINLGGMPRGGGNLNIFENPSDTIKKYSRVPESV